MTTSRASVPRPSSCSQADAAERRERRAEVDDPAAVIEAAARFLEARPRSVDEVRRKLTRLGYQPSSSRARGPVADLGFLDDDSFARAWVKSRIERGHGGSTRCVGSWG